MASKAIIVGFGNTLRGDDGLGQAVAAVLAAAPPEGADVLACHQLTPELAEQLAAAALAVFVDAAAGAPAGSIAVEPYGRPPRAPGWTITSTPGRCSRSPPGSTAARRRHSSSASVRDRSNWAPTSRPPCARRCPRSWPRWPAWCARTSPAADPMPPLRARLRAPG